MDVLKRGVRPSHLITREALENAIAAVAASGGSTNAVLHLLAIAREAGVELRLEDFDRISAKVPLLADLKPGGRFVAVDLHRAGGTRLLAARLQQAGVLHSDAGTVSGRTIGEEAKAAVETPGQEVIRPVATPLKPTGGLVILRGNLAPDGCVVKVAGHDYGVHRGPARVFDGEEAAFEAVQAGRINHNDVVVIRHEGPKGGPGMREMLAVTAAHHGRRPRRLGRARHRRTVLRSHARVDGRARRAGGGARRADRRRAGRRPHHARSESPDAPSRCRRRRAPERLDDGRHGLAGMRRA